MSLLKNIFGKKAIQQGPLTTNQPQGQNINNEIKTPTEALVRPSESKPAFPPIDEKNSKPDMETLAKPYAKMQEKPKTEPDSMPKTPSVLRSTFPIFISSTFADKQAEHDHLKNVVFPKDGEELQNAASGSKSWACSGESTPLSVNRKYICNQGLLKRH
jgi:hypothetical protein